MTDAIIFDFDGVILDSLKVKDDGFRELFSEFPKEAVDCLMAYHHDHGGVSRFVKIRYMFETILHKDITDDTVMVYADKFSKIMLSKLGDPSFLIHDCVNFIKAHHNKVPMHVASGTEENELRSLCATLGLSEYFRTVYGSPMEKKDVVGKILSENGYNPSSAVMIGDSMTDHDAARHNDMIFCGYNNKKLENVSDFYINNFNSFSEHFGIM